MFRYNFSFDRIIIEESKLVSQLYYDKNKVHTFRNQRIFYFLSSILFLLLCSFFFIFSIIPYFKKFSHPETKMPTSSEIVGNGQNTTEKIEWKYWN